MRAGAGVEADIEINAGPVSAEATAACDVIAG